ncbi:UNVERIFIED_CONTAM: G2/mitotic-specific cyclin-2 [Sesamum indicum]
MWLPVGGARGSSFLRFLDRLRGCKCQWSHCGQWSSAGKESCRAQKKAAATTKPKPEEIIEISPDITEVAELKEKAGEKLMKKKAPTLTSTLTAILQGCIQRCK